MAAAPEQQQQLPAGTSSSTTPRLRVHDTTLVPPPSPSPPETSLPLTFFDIFWLHSPPVERLLLYRLAADADVATIISSLRDSLQEAVRAFYPLAGRIRLTPGTSNRYELHYQPGDAVTFTVAEYDDDDTDIDGVTTDEPREVAKIATLVPTLPEGGGLLALQATLLPARRGLAIGVTVHHAACDGSVSTHFLHTWAAAACSSASGAAGATEAPPLLPPPVIIDRTLVPDPRGMYDVFFQAEMSTDEMEFVKMSADQLIATFALSKDDLTRVKETVADEAARRRVAPPRCSSLVATFGFVWSCYQRAKDEAESTITGAGAGPSPSPSPMTYLLIPVDHRTRVKPPLPDKYFGNCVGPAFAVAPKAELAAAGAAGLFSACTAVAAAIDEAVRDIGTPAMDAWVDRIKEAGATGTLSAAGSPRFRVYDLDFGFGHPAKVDIVSVARTGALAMAESRSSGTGGMEIGVSLPPAGMQRYHKCFVDGIAWLHQRSSHDS